MQWHTTNARDNSRLNLNDSLDSQRKDAPTMTTNTEINDTTDEFTNDESMQAPMTESKRAEMEAYVATCTLEVGTRGYEVYEEQCARQMKLPDLFEYYGDIEEANKENSRRVRCYIPWDLAEEWEQRHESARSASLLLQEALRAELERTPEPAVCKACGGISKYKETIWLGGNLGDTHDSEADMFTCTSCKKSQLYEVESWEYPGVFEPSELERHELWRYDNGIVWVREGQREPSEYDLALKGFLTWTDYRRELEKNLFEDDPGRTKYIAAHAGKRVWDDLMTRWVDSDIERIRSWLSSRESVERPTPKDRDEDDMPF
jgi:hypothetical protein